MTKPPDFDDFRSPPFILDAEAMAWVSNTFERLTLKDRIGQLLLPDGPPKAGAGGTFLRCAKTASDLRAEAQAARKLPGVPLLVAADIEFAAQGRILEGTSHPCQMAVGATGDAEAARRMGSIAGAEGRACGIDWTFSPVADLAYNHRSPSVNIRAFGADAAAVARMVAAYVKGVQEAGIAATLKHWPGDGDDERDPHFATTSNGLSMREWRAAFGETFAAGIRAGAKAVMSGHISLPAYLHEAGIKGAEALLPASLSRALNFDLLRNQLGFAGLVVSDAMVMGGAVSCAPWAALAPAMVAAGCDMVLFPPPFPEAIAYFERALELGSLSENRIAEAAARVLAFKASLGLHRSEAERKSAFSNADAKSGQNERRGWARECAEKSITLVKDSQRILPLSAEKTPRILLFLSRPEDTLGHPDPFLMDILLEERGFEVTLHRAGTTIDRDLFDLILYVVEEPPMFTAESLKIKWSRFGSTRQAAMRRYWQDYPVLFVSLGSPFHPFEIPSCRTLVNAYSASETSQKALAAALTGEIPFLGKSPVDPFCGRAEESAD